VGHKFTLILSREITGDESALLSDAGCAAAVLGTDTLPTNADVTVTRMDFDDTASPSLAEAIESALEAVKKVPDLNVPGLTVPAQPAEPAAETGGPDVVAGEVITEAEPTAEPTAKTEAEPTAKTAAAPAKKAPARKAAAKKSGTKKTAAKKTAEADDAKEPVEAATGPA
jgi:hypothetical protein